MNTFIERSQYMKTKIRSYRLPIVVTSILIIVLAFWSWQTWQSFNDHVYNVELNRAIGVSNILAAVVSTLNNSKIINNNEVEKIVKDVIRDSPYEFMVIKQNGRNIIQVGAIPAKLHLPSLETYTITKGYLIFSCFIKIKKSKKNKLSLALHDIPSISNGLGDNDGKHLIIIGGDIRGHGSPNIITHVVIPLGAALFLLSASIVAWIMTIKSRILAEQLRAERAHTAHLEDLGLAAAGLAHETKNPLGIISGIAQQIINNPDMPEQGKVMIETIIDEVDKSASRLGYFMTFARQREINAIPLDLQNLISRVTSILQAEFDAADVKLNVDCPPIFIIADEDMLRQILVNLLLNSLQASSNGSTVTIKVEQHGKWASLTIKDDGCGISSELLPTIFKPYTTNKPEGHGLGLAIVKRFVEGHGWLVTAKSQLDVGTTILVTGIKLTSGKRDSE